MVQWLCINHDFSACTPSRRSITVKAMKVTKKKKKKIGPCSEQQFRVRHSLYQQMLPTQLFLDITGIGKSPQPKILLGFLTRATQSIWQTALRTSFFDEVSLQKGSLLSYICSTVTVSKSSNCRYSLTCQFSAGFFFRHHLA